MAEAKSAGRSAGGTESSAATSLGTTADASSLPSAGEAVREQTEQLASQAREGMRQASAATAAGAGAALRSGSAVTQGVQDITAAWAHYGEEVMRQTAEASRAMMNCRSLPEMPRGAGAAAARQFAGISRSEHEDRRDRRPHCLAPVRGDAAGRRRPAPTLRATLAISAGAFLGRAPSAGCGRGAPVNMAQPTVGRPPSRRSIGATVRSIGAEIELAGAEDPGFRVGDHLAPMRNPADRARDGENRREHRRRQAQSAEDNA